MTLYVENNMSIKDMCAVIDRSSSALGYVKSGENRVYWTIGRGVVQ